MNALSVWRRTVPMALLWYIVRKTPHAAGLLIARPPLRRDHRKPSPTARCSFIDRVTPRTLIKSVVPQEARRCSSS